MHEKQNETCNNHLVERSVEFDDIREKFDINKLIYNFKTKEKLPKDFRNYQVSLKLFENLKDGDVDPKEVLKNKLKFKSDLIKIKIGSNK